MAKISVPQSDGEIIMRHAGAEPVTYKVSNGQVTVAAEDVDRFLRQIDGSQLVGGSPAASTPPKES